ncbi:hypothetical protein CB0940_00921 [Cercospora beticola]|uniref:Uncharacterized protein n=1 Tax=Cercospora beticola TaxID=122368 RepID=A0A2G5IAY9_CERBT|nr:hypothetical protein CB0940_00921 [Cercospora beticola]PIB01959.1 hypothetical protein CB0940_00921 [Cercospora beticola]
MLVVQTSSRLPVCVIFSFSLQNNSKLAFPSSLHDSTRTHQSTNTSSFIPKHQHLRTHETHITTTRNTSTTRGHRKHGRRRLLLQVRGQCHHKLLYGCCERHRGRPQGHRQRHRLRLLGYRLVPDLRQGWWTSEEGNNERGLAFVTHQEHHPIVDLDTVGKQHAFRRVRMRTFE